MFAHPFFYHKLNSESCDVRTLYLKELVCDAEIGVYRSEKHRTQKIVVNLAVQIASPTRLIGDDVANVLDYNILRDAVHNLICAKHINLQETLCDALADFCLSIPTVQAVYARIGKLEAFDDCEAVGCEVLRHRQQAR